jgi:hypothetical protein
MKQTSNSFRCCHKTHRVVSDSNVSFSIWFLALASLAVCGGSHRRLSFCRVPSDFSCESCEIFRLNACARRETEIRLRDAACEISRWRQQFDQFLPFEPLVVIVTMALPIVTPPEQDSSAPPEGGNRIDLHEVAKGWKAAIARAKDPATR